MVLARQALRVVPSRAWMVLPVVGQMHVLVAGSTTLPGMAEQSVTDLQHKAWSLELSPVVGLVVASGSATEPSAHVKLAQVCKTHRAYRGQ